MDAVDGGKADTLGSQNTAPRRRRKRARVPSEQRQRVVVACCSCRRLKEKCDGIVPCERCRRHGRHCEINLQEPRTAPSRPAVRHHAASSTPDERTKHLEAIARHFLGDVSLDTHGLSRIVQGLKSGRHAATEVSLATETDTLELDTERFTVVLLPGNTTYYSGELSHWNFAQCIKKQVDERLLDSHASGTQESSRVFDFWRPEHLKSRHSSVKRIMESLPPKQVAIFLIKVYFQYAQTNVFFVDESWVSFKVELMYSKANQVSTDDAPWLCTTLLVFAVATQFAHMVTAAHHFPDSLSSNKKDEDAAAESAGIAFYQMAADLNPDIITIASMESVQACLMLAHYVMPLDTQGLAYTYLGLALRMAIQNGMHRGRGPGNSDADVRLRLWWTAYSLEKRVSVLHGRPSSISASEIDVDYPPDRTSSTIYTSGQSLENTMLRITDWLGDIAFVIHMLRKSPRNLQSTYFERLLQVRQQYKQWWNTAGLPKCSSPESRSVWHIHMTHHLNLIFLGRPFVAFTKSNGDNSIINEREGPGQPPQVESPRARRYELISDAVGSAQQIVATCQNLQSTVGLAKASYIEFTSCRAAVMMLLAQSLYDTSDELRQSVASGMCLIREMASANLSTRSDASVLAAIEAGLQQLHKRDHAETSTDTDQSSPAQLQANAGQADVLEPVQPDAQMQEAFGGFGWLPFDASDPFATIDDNSLFNSEDLDNFHFDEAFSIATGSLLGDILPRTERGDVTEP